MSDLVKWSCDERAPERGCRNTYGCHCKEITSQAARIEALEAENKRLVDFANRVIDVAFDGGTLDGGEIQDMASSCGLVETTMATEENRDMWEHIDYMEIGDDFYVKSGPLRRAKAAMEVK